MDKDRAHPSPSAPSRPGKEAQANEAGTETSLDPADWASARALAHQALDEALDFLESVRERPVWRPVPDALKKQICGPVPTEGVGLEETFRQFQEQILPYATGNVHPRFFGWVHGTGTVAGVLAEMLTATMNSNCGGRDHGAVYVERCVIDWCKQVFNFPSSGSGLLVSGTSMGTLVALTVARNAMAGWDVRKEGMDSR